MTSDLKTIVFADWKGHETEYDLYIAVREAVDGPFESPQRVEACVSSWTDAYPTLSSDGLELVYVSSDDAHPSTPPKLLHSWRAKAGLPFSDPEELKLPAVDAAGQRLATPQFIDPLRLSICLIESESVRSVRVARREKRSAGFSAVDALPVANPWLLWWTSADGLRAYTATEKGLSLSYRTSADVRFGDPETLTRSEAMGRVDGPIWLSPQEDAVFYCTSKPGQPGEGRFLWMMAF